MAQDFPADNPLQAPAFAEEHPFLSEREEVLVEWNRTATPYPRDTPVHALFAEQARLRPDATALVCGGVRLSYAELDGRAEALARRLRAEGVRRGHAVGVLAGRGAGLVVALLGVLKAGAAYVPVEAGQAWGRARWMLEDAGAVVSVTQGGAGEGLRGAGWQGRAVEVGPGGEVEAGGEEIGAEAEAGEAARAEGDGGVGGDDLAYVMYTSGSTGTPKGVCVTHRNVARLVKGNYFADLGPEEVMLQLAPPSFDASTFEVWGALLNGGQLAVMPPGAPSLEELGAAVTRYGVTTLWLTAGLFHQMVDAQPDALRGLRQLLAGGDVLSPSHVERLLAGETGCVLINGYGPTENTTFTCTHRMEAGWQLAGASVPIGRPIANTRAYVLDGRMRPVGVGVAGELYAGGDGVARGYLNRPGLTAERFVPDPFSDEPGARLYRTGDQARWLPGGEVEFLGRLDGQVKVRGFRVELGEVEAALGLHPSVGDAAVLARGEESGGKSLVAYVVWRGEEAASAGVLRNHLRERVPEYMVPSAFVFLEALPLTPNGKVDRRALPAPNLTRAELEAEYVAVRTPLEERLAEIWQEVLGTDRVGIHDSFFELGGHSLKATQIVSRVRNTLQTDVPLHCIFESPTVAAMAQHIEQGGPSSRTLQVSPLRPMGRSGAVPLSFSQERIWFLQRLAPDSRAYNFQATLRFKGLLDAAALERSLNEIVRRHEVLRTTFPEVDERPVQLIHPYEPFTVPSVDLGQHTEGARGEALQRHIQQEIQKPFDLTRLPLMRWTLYRLSDSEHVLLHMEHHLLHDGWAFNVLLDELFRLYKAFSAGKPSPLPDMDVQFADFALWQRRWMEAGAADAQLEYWKKKLAGASGVLDLPLDRRRPALQSFRGRVLRVSLSDELGRRVRQFGRREGVSLFMTMLTAFLTLLHRYTGQEDICVGCGIANRRWRETEGLIGMIINNVVSRTDLSGDPALRELLGRVREVTLETYANQDVPFEKVVEAVQPQRGLSYNPLFQVSFSFHDSPLPEAELPGLEVSVLEGISNGSAKFDLNVIVIPRSEGRVTSDSDDDGLTLLWEYNTDLFDETTAARMVEHYERALERLVSSPEQHLAEVDLLGEREREEVLVEWNRTAAPYPRDTPVHTLFAEQARLRPDATAVVCGGVRLSYAELDVRAEALARRLRAAGVGPDVRVGVLLERSAELVVSLLAVLKAGGAYIPLDPDYPAERVAFMLGDASARVLLTQSRLRAGVPETAAAVVCVDEELRDTAGSDSGEGPAVEVSTGNLAYVIYTSGSTGTPKGVEVQHGGLVNLVTWHQRTYDITPDDRATQIAGIAFDASVWEIWPYLAAGASVYIADDETRSDPSRLLQWLAVNKISVCFLPTPLAEAVLRERLPDDLALRFMLIGADVLHRAPENSLPFTLVNHYGPTESTVVATYTPVAPAGESDRMPPIGRPIANTRVYILNGRLGPVPVGAAGELYVGGDGVARGYLRRPGLTAERFVPDPFSEEPGARLYRTGDRARFLADGQVEFLGRLDGQVKVRGFRVELGEVEAALGLHPSVGDAAVLARGKESGGKSLVAYVVWRDEEAANAGVLRSHLRERVPDYMVPSAFVFLEALPLTPNGKVDRRALAALGGAEEGPAPEEERAATEVEERVAHIWREVLGRERVGLRENFFELGGHSLLATRVVSRVRESFGVEVALRSIFEAPTVSQFAELVEETLLDYLENVTDEQAQDLFGS